MNEAIIGFSIALLIVICGVGLVAFASQIKNYVESRKPVSYVCSRFVVPESYSKYLETRDASLVIDKVKREVWLDGRLATEVAFNDIIITGVDSEIGPFKFDTITQNLIFKNRSINCMKRT